MDLVDLGVDLRVDLADLGADLVDLGADFVRKGIVRKGGSAYGERQQGGGGSKFSCETHPACACVHTYATWYFQAFDFFQRFIDCFKQPNGFSSVFRTLC